MKGPEVGRQPGLELFLTQSPSRLEYSEPEGQQSVTRLLRQLLMSEGQAGRAATLCGLTLGSLGLSPTPP